MSNPSAPPKSKGLSKAMIKRPAVCKGCPLEKGPGGYVPPFCDCRVCSSNTARAVNDLVGGVECEAPILAVGMAPGGEEERRQVPLVGPSGRMFHTALHLANYRGPIRKLNLVQCRTVRPGLSRQYVNRDPRKAEVEFCRKIFLDHELAAFKARQGPILIMLGGLCFDHINQDTFGSFAQARGHRLDL